MFLKIMCIVSVEQVAQAQTVDGSSSDAFFAELGGNAISAVLSATKY
jgi:hypothetical protein